MLPLLKRAQVYIDPADTSVATWPVGSWVGCRSAMDAVVKPTDAALPMPSRPNVFRPQQAMLPLTRSTQQWYCPQVIFATWPSAEGNSTLCVGGLFAL